MREKLAELAHEQWAGWMEYLFSNGTFNDDGTWTMPAWAVDRWAKQMKTFYGNLSESEKNSDRTEADKFLMVINKGDKMFIAHVKQSGNSCGHFAIGCGETLWFLKSENRVDAMAELKSRLCDDGDDFLSRNGWDDAPYYKSATLFDVSKEYKIPLDEWYDV